MASRGWCGTEASSSSAVASTRPGPPCRGRPASFRSWTRSRTGSRGGRRRWRRPWVRPACSSSRGAPTPSARPCSGPTPASPTSRPPRPTRCAAPFPVRTAGRGRARRRTLRRNPASGRERLAARLRSPARRHRARGRLHEPLMPLDFVLDRFTELSDTRALVERLLPAGTRLAVSGLPGSAPAVLVSALARQLPQRVFVCVAPTATDAERWLADVAALAGETAALYPQREALGAEEAHFEIAGERVETLEALLGARVRILVTTARATAERTGVPAAVAAMRVVLERGAGKGERGRESLSDIVR